MPEQAPQSAIARARKAWCSRQPQTIQWQSEKHHHTMGTEVMQNHLRGDAVAEEDARIRLCHHHLAACVDTRILPACPLACLLVLLKCRTNPTPSSMVHTVGMGSGYGWVLTPNTNSSATAFLRSCCKTEMPACPFFHLGIQIQDKKYRLLPLPLVHVLVTIHSQNSGLQSPQGTPSSWPLGSRICERKEHGARVSLLHQGCEEFSRKC